MSERFDISDFAFFSNLFGIWCLELRICLICTGDRNRMCDPRTVKSQNPTLKYQTTSNDQKDPRNSKL